MRCTFTVMPKPRIELDMIQANSVCLFLQTRNGQEDAVIEVLVKELEHWRRPALRGVRRATCRRRPDQGHSVRRACMTLTRAARTAGSIDATTATAINTKADSETGNAPGILISK